MRIAMLGSGGIGGYYGTLLARAGHDVVFIVRGAHLEAMQRYGLKVRTPTGESTLPVTAVADTGRVEPVDLVLFSVKSYDTEPAAHSLAPLMARDTVVLTVQNGLDNAESIASVVGFEAVLAGSAYVALQLAGPGVVVRTGGEGRIVFGEQGGVVTERVQRLSKALRDAGIPHDVSTDIDRVLWQKFLFVAGIGGITALAGSGIGPLLGSARRRAGGRGSSPSGGSRVCHRAGGDAAAAVAIVTCPRPRRWSSPRGGGAERGHRSARPEARHRHPGASGHRGMPVGSSARDFRYAAPHTTAGNCISLTGIVSPEFCLRILVLGVVTIARTPVMSDVGRRPDAWRLLSFICSSMSVRTPLALHQSFRGYPPE